MLTIPYSLRGAVAIKRRAPLINTATTSTTHFISHHNTSCARDSREQKDACQWLYDANKMHESMPLYGFNGASSSGMADSMSACALQCMCPATVRCSDAGAAQGTQKRSLATRTNDSRKKNDLSSTSAATMSDESAELLALQHDTQTELLYQALHCMWSAKNAHQAKPIFLAPASQPSASATWPWESEARGVASWVAANIHREDALLLSVLLSVVEDAGDKKAQQAAILINALIDALRAQGGAELSSLPWMIHCMTNCGSTADANAWLETLTQLLCALSWTRLGDTTTSNKNSNNNNRYTTSSHTVAFSAIHTVLERTAGSSYAQSTADPHGIRDAAPADFIPDSLRAWLSPELLHTVRRRFLKATTTSSLRSLRPYWRWTIVEMVRSGGRSVDALFDAGSKVSKESAQSHLYRAVGVFQSLRRFSSALGKHQRLQPLIELHCLACGYQQDQHIANDNSICQAMRQRRRDILEKKHPALLWREVVLLDAYTLINIGHTSERALDWTPVSTSPLCIGFLDFLREACLSHLSEVETAEQLHPRARSRMVGRLQEALRLLAKVYLRLGDAESIRVLHKRCPTLGGSWEVGKALAGAGQYEDALAVYRTFIDDTRHQYPNALPRFILSLISRSIQGIARVPGKHADELLIHYGALRQWHVSMPPALCLEALVEGIAEREDTDAVHTVMDVLQGVSTAHPHDGITVKTVEQFVTLSLQRTHPTAEEGIRVQDVEVEASFVSLVIHLVRLHPLLPLTRIVITRCLRDGHLSAVTAILEALVEPFEPTRLPNNTDRCDSKFSFFVDRTNDATTAFVFTDAYLQALFNTFPLIALEQLEECLLLTAASSPETTRRIAAQTKLKPLVGAARVARKAEQESLEPWQCALCTTWNSRLVSSCKLCRALKVAVVQCAICSCFSTNKETHCLVCSNRLRSVTEGGLDPAAVKMVLPLREWTCGGCHHLNDSRHALLCGRCGVPHHSIAATLSDTAYSCPGCARVNKLGLLRPWCQTCGTLAPAVGSSPRSSQWWCAACYNFTSWMQPHCGVCGGDRPQGTAADPRVEVPWINSTCSSCKTTNTVSAVQCRSCAAKINPGSAVRNAFQDCLRAWCKTSLHVQMSYTTPVDNVEEKTTPVTEQCRISHCGHCGSSYSADEGEPPLVCSHCYALHPSTPFIQRWICLHDNCLQVNIGTGERCSRCRRQREGSVAVWSSGPNLLGYRSTSKWAWQLMPVVVAASSPPRRCPSCATYLPLSNITGVCSRCGHYCGESTLLDGDCSTALRLRIMLNTAHTVCVHPTAPIQKETTD